MLSRPTLIWINRLLWTFLVGAVLVLGAVVSLGRYYLPYVETHQAQLIAEFKQRTGLSISVGHLSARWQRLSPYLIVDDFKLFNPQHPDQTVLQIAHAELRLGIFRSIDARTIAISKVEGNGVQIALEEASLGRWSLPGFAGGDNVGFDRAMDFLLAIYRAELRDTAIDLHFFGGGEAHLTGEQLRLQRVGDFRRLNLALTVADRSAPLTLVVEADGDPRDTDKFSARAHAAFSGLDLTPLLPAIKSFGIDLQQGRIDGVAWMDWRRGGAIEMRGRASMPLFDIAHLTGRELPPLKNIAAEFIIRDAAGQRRLWLPKLSLQWGDNALDFSQLLITEDVRSPDTVQLQMPTFNLATIRDSLLAIPALPDGARQALAALAPAGELRNLLLTVPTAPSRSEAFRLRSIVADLGVGAWQGAPGANGIAGYVDAGLHGGTFDLNAGKMELIFPHVYRDAVRFDSVLGRVGWRLEADRVHVNSGPIQTDSDAGHATALFALDLPHDHREAPLMTLMVGLRNSAAEYRDRFIPYTLSPHLLEWLGSSVRGGKIPSGGFIYRGSLIGMQHMDYTVQLFLDVRDGRLKYQPDWPELTDIRAAVWIDDDSLLVQSPAARTFDQIVARDVQVEMHPGADGSWMTVQGDVLARNDDALRLLRESPLHHRIGGVLDSWQWRGDIDAKLDLGFALSGARPQQLQVDAELDGGQLSLPEQGLALTDVRGPLSYRSEGGLTSPAIAATWYGRPLNVKVNSDDKGALQVEIAGRAAMADIRDWLQQPLFDYSAGETDFNATLRVAGEDSELKVWSDLRGVTIKLPPPYAKAAAEDLPLTLSMPMAGDRKLFAALGGLADLQLSWGDDKSLQSGVLRLGQTGKVNAGSNRFVVTGAAPAVNLDEWRELLTHFRAATATPADASQSQRLALQLRDLHFDQAGMSGQTLRDLTLSGQHENNGWQLYLRADMAAGSIVLPDVAQQPWQLHLDYLHLPAPASAAASATPATSTANVDSEPAHTPSMLDDIDPRNVIPLDFRVARLWRGDEELGWVELQLRPIADGLQVQQLTGELRGIRIEPRGEQAASLTWTRQSGGDRSQFRGRLAVADIAPVLQRWHFEKALTSKSGHLDADLSWAGRPDQVKLKNTGGEAELAMKDGRFLKASGSTTGALKVVGIFNFANFLRRLQLDFSDVFKDGVSFDSMDGGFTLQNGVVNTSAPVEIKSPSSTFRIAGNIDFNTDQTDMELIATLPVARNLPWMAALAAGLPAAAGVYVASRIFENQVDKIASVAYDIDGPWTDPKVKLKRVFDDKLPQKNSPQGNNRSATNKIARAAP